MQNIEDDFKQHRVVMFIVLAVAAVVGLWLLNKKGSSSTTAGANGAATSSSGTVSADTGSSDTVGLNSSGLSGADGSYDGYGWSVAPGQHLPSTVIPSTPTPAPVGAPSSPSTPSNPTPPPAQPVTQAINTPAPVSVLTAISAPVTAARLAPAAAAPAPRVVLWPTPPTPPAQAADPVYRPPVPLATVAAFEYRVGHPQPPSTRTIPGSAVRPTYVTQTSHFIQN